MFSIIQKREISAKIQQILRATGHPELPAGEIQFHLRVEGATATSWADIKNNGAVATPDVNPHNEAMDPANLKAAAFRADGCSSSAKNKHDDGLPKRPMTAPKLTVVYRKLADMTNYGRHYASNVLNVLEPCADCYQPTPFWTENRHTPLCEACCAKRNEEYAAR